MSGAQKEMVQSVFEGIGIAVWVEDEALLHGVTALSGSGPAYFFLMLESLEAAATEAGVNPETARQLAIQTMAGAAEMAAKSEHDPSPASRKMLCLRTVLPSKPFTPLKKAVCAIS